MRDVHPPMGVGSAVALLALSRIGPSPCHQPERTDSPDQKISTGQAKLLGCMVPEYRDLNKADLISHSLTVQSCVSQGCGRALPPEMEASVLN